MFRDAKGFFPILCKEIVSSSLVSNNMVYKRSIAIRVMSSFRVRARGTEAASRDLIT